MSYPRILFSLGLFVAVGISLIAANNRPSKLPLTPGASMTSAAKAFLETLDKDDTQQAVYKFGAKERLEWHFIPKNERKGLQVKNMDADQRAAAEKLLRVCLSKAGFKKAQTIMKLEGLLHAIEKGRGNIRDPERYYYTIFGEPSEQSKWGLSIEGHHLSLNFVVDKNELVSVSPAFFAANPAIVKTDIYQEIKQGTRVLAAEEKLAFRLVKSLDDEQKSSAIFAAKAPKEIRAAGAPQPPNEKAIGISVEKLDQKQRATLKKLVRTYAGNFPKPIAAEKMAAIEKNGWEKIKFAWGGATKPGIGHYYRIQGPSFLIEFVNTQPDAQGNPANHIHCVWRNPNGDFALNISQ